MDNQDMLQLENLAAQADALGAEARGESAPGSSGEPGQNQAAGASPAPEVLDSAQKEAEAITEILAEGVEMLVPALGFKPETRSEFARKLGAVMAKHGWGVGVGKWKEEIELGAFTAGLVIGSIKALKDAKPVTDIPTDTVKPDGVSDGGK